MAELSSLGGGHRDATAARSTAAHAVPIVALDRPALDAALAPVDELGDSCRFYKIGLELYTAAGPAAVAALRERGAEVFLDLKLHDIPATVRAAARQAATLGARLLTVHASGGGPMIEAAVAGAAEGRRAGEPECGILAVTVLTSLDAATLATAWGRDAVRTEHEVVRLAELAARSGAHGIVCSGEEIAAVRTSAPSLALLVPGLRMPGDAPDDQVRVVTPAAASAAGARYLVLGRTVTAASEPRAAMERVLASLRL